MVVLAAVALMAAARQGDRSNKTILTNTGGLIL